MAPRPFLLAWLAFGTGVGTCWGTTPVPSPAPMGPAIRFEDRTVWGTITGKVSPTTKGCLIEVGSDAWTTGWLLRTQDGSRTLSKGGMSPTRRFHFEVFRPFREPFLLTLYLVSDHEQVPVALRLEPSSSAEGSAGNGPDPADYQENPDHPYHRMVRHLYDQALADFNKGDLARAQRSLGKARELDPNQPQVSALWERIGAPGPAADPLSTVKKDIADGDREKALALLTDILRKDPEDPEALGLREWIQGPAHKGRKPRPSRTDPGPPPRPAAPPVQDPKDVMAKADGTYNLGLESYRRDDYGAAKKFWEETLRIQPGHIQARRNLDRLRQEHPGLK